MQEGTRVETDRNFDIAGPGGRIVDSSEVPSVCVFINDAVSVHGGYSEEELGRFERGEADIPLTPGFSYNAFVRNSTSKVFIMAARDIAPDEEIFYSYGR